MTTTRAVSSTIAFALYCCGMSWIIAWCAVLAWGVQDWMFAAGPASIVLAIIIKGE